MDNVEVFNRQAVNGPESIELGIAKNKLTKEELRAKAEKHIYHARNMTRLLMITTLSRPPKE